MTKHRISFLQEWNDHLTLNAEVLSKFLHDFRDLKTSGFSGQIFSITEVFAIWNKISGFRNVGKDCKALVVEARYILFDWTFLKLSKGRVSPVFTVNDGDKLLTMGLCIFEEAEEMNCHPDYLDELLENLRKIYQSNYKKAITELSSHIFHNKGILLFAEVLNAYIISTLINFKAFDENLLDLYGSVIQNIPQDMFPLLLGKLCRTFGKHKQVSELPRSFFKMFEMLFIKLKIWHRENTLEEHKPIVREYLVTILDLYLLCNDEHCPPQYFDLLDDLGESSRYKLLKIKISIKRKTPSNLFNHEVADYLKSFPTLVAAKPHIAELLDFVSESENLSFILDLVNHLIKTISGIFSVPLDQLSELGIYKCWLLANCSQQDDLHIFQDMKNFLTEILENSVETKQSSWESKSFHHIASILFEKAQDYHRNSMLQHAIRWYDLVLFVLSLIDSEEIQAVVHRHLFRCYLSVNTPKALEYLTFSEKNSTSTCNLVCRFEYLISCELYVEALDFLSNLPDGILENYSNAIFGCLKKVNDEEASKLFLDNFRKKAILKDANNLLVLLQSVYCQIIPYNLISTVEDMISPMIESVLEPSQGYVQLCWNLGLLLADSGRFLEAFQYFRFSLLFHRKSSVNTSNENKDESVEIVVPSIFLLFQSAALWMQSFEDFNESTQNYHQSIRNNSEYENILVQALAILSAVDYTSSSEANEPSLLIPKIESFKIEFEMRALMIEKSTESLFTFISKWGDNLSSLEYLAGRLLLRSECPIQAKFDILKRILLKYSEDKSSLANENIRLWIRSFLCVSISLDTKSSVQQVKYILEWLQRDLLVYFSREELFWIIQQFLKVTEFWMGVYQYQKALSWIELAIFFIRMWKEGVVFPHEVAELQSLLQDIDLRFYQEILGQLG